MSSHLALVQKNGRLKNVLIISKACAKKHLHVVLVVISLAWDGSSRSESPYYPFFRTLFLVIIGLPVKQSYNHSKYETQPLEEALISAFSDEEYLFGGSRPQETFAADVKVAVTTTSAAGSPVILTNYNRICDEKRELHRALSTFFEYS